MAYLNTSSLNNSPMNTDNTPTMNNVSNNNPANNVNNSGSSSSSSSFPDSSLFVQRIRKQETARRINEEEKRRQEEDSRIAQYNQLIRTQTETISTALRNALNSPNDTHIEVTFSEKVCEEVLRTIISNGYEYSLNYINDNNKKTSTLKVYPRGTMSTQEYINSNNSINNSLFNTLDRYLDNIFSYRPWRIRYF